MADDVLDWIEQMDRCWLEGRFDDLDQFLAPDVVIAAPGGVPRLTGAAGAIESYRAFTGSSRIEHYCTRHPEVTVSGEAAVVEHDWEMAWTAGGERRESRGRELLGLARHDGDWRLLWRVQLPG